MPTWRSTPLHRQGKPCCHSMRRSGGSWTTSRSAARAPRPKPTATRCAASASTSSTPARPRRARSRADGGRPVGFARWISEGGRTPRTTVHLYTTAVARFYAYLVRERHRPDLPLEAIRVRLGQLRGKRPKKLPRVPPDDVMERVLAAAHGVPTARSRAGESIRLRDIALTET